MPFGPNDPLEVTLAPTEWASVLIEMLQQAVYDTARPTIERIVAGTGNTVALTATDWNEILAMLRNGRYSTVAPLIQKIFTQANAVQPVAQPVEQPINGIDSGDTWPEHEVKAPSPATRNRRQANIEANAGQNRD